MMLDDIHYHAGSERKDQQRGELEDDAMDIDVLGGDNEVEQPGNTDFPRHPVQGNGESSSSDESSEHDDDDDADYQLQDHPKSSSSLAPLPTKKHSLDAFSPPESESAMAPTQPEFLVPLRPHRVTKRPRQSETEGSRVDLIPLWIDDANNETFKKRLEQWKLASLSSSGNFMSHSLLIVYPQCPMQLMEMLSKN